MNRYTGDILHKGQKGRMGQVSVLAGAVLLAFSATALAGPNDGLEDFSLDPDAAQGQINFSGENGNFGPDFVIPIEQGDQIDALSSHHRGTPWNHNVDLQRMLFGSLRMDFSIDADSNIFEWTVGGPPPVPLGPGRTVGLDGHFQAGANPAGITSAHDADTTLGLATVDAAGNETEDRDLDALEHHTHRAPYPEPFPGAPTNWENNPANVYFSTERGPTDQGDVFNMGAGLGSPYFDDADPLFAPILSELGLTIDNFNIDGLIVYDLEGGFESFDGLVADPNDLASAVLGSDAIFFSVEGLQGATDSKGDNVYWVSAATQGNSYIGGLYHDPGLEFNVDALDVHVPEPGTLLLIGIGLAGLGYGRGRRSSR